MLTLYKLNLEQIETDKSDYWIPQMLAKWYGNKSFTEESVISTIDSKLDDWGASVEEFIAMLELGYIEEA